VAAPIFPDFAGGIGGIDRSAGGWGWVGGVALAAKGISASSFGEAERLEAGGAGLKKLSPMRPRADRSRTEPRSPPRAVIRGRASWRPAAAVNSAPDCRLGERPQARRRALWV